MQYYTVYCAHITERGPLLDIIKSLAICSSDYGKLQRSQKNKASSKSGTKSET